MSDINYKACVVKIKNLDILPQLDNCVGSNIFGNRVIIGKETKIGDIGIFFPVESQIGNEFLKANNLYKDKSFNSDISKKGFFELNGRVRAIKLKGHQSAGFWIPIESLYTLNIIGGLPSEGTEFTEYQKYQICQKYISKHNPVRNSGTSPKSKTPRISKVIDSQFKFHFDTTHLEKNIHKILPEDLISISWKKHGTSAIAANVNCKIVDKSKLTIRERIASWILKGSATEYDYLYASRKVVKNEFESTRNHYYGHDLWTEIGKENFQDKIHKGETIYYEILGFIKNGGYIQKQYDYSCNTNECKIEVYRITMTNSDGIVTELQTTQMIERCKELGVNTVEFIYSGVAKKFLSVFDDKSWSEDFLSILKHDYVYDQDCQFCTNKVPSEGICVRKEGLNIEIFKLKNFRFMEHETKLKDKEVLDIEETGEVHEES